MNSRNALIIATIVLLLAAAGALHGAPSCEDLRTSVRAEPAWFSEQCMVSPVYLEKAAPAAKALSDTAYAHDISPVSDNFVVHSLNNFPGQTIVGDSSREIFGYDFDPGATTLYALANDTKELGTINLGSGAFSAIGSSVPRPGHDWTGLTIDPVVGTLYASSTNLVESSLYTLNPLTGAATLIGTDPSINAVIDIAANCEGEIYAHDIDSDAIFEINPVTGLGTLVGPTGVDSNFAQGMDFDNDAGTLYAWTYQGLGANQYGTINLATGELTPLSIDDPIGEFEGTTQTTCAGIEPPLIFVDGFESGNTNGWSADFP